jgi:hypothetical protein
MEAFRQATERGMTPTDVYLACTAQTVQDATGRTLALRRLNALDKLRLFKAAGPVLAQNPLWLGMATLAAAVTDIDGVPVPPPVNEAQIEALVGKLGDAGIAAIATALAPVADSPSLAVHAGN